MSARPTVKPVIRFTRFSKKQMKLLTWWCDGSPYESYNGIIADGSIRAGKTVAMAISFVLWAMDTYEGMNFAMCGKTVGSFRRNVWAWLKHVLTLRGYLIDERRTQNLITISRGHGRNYFYIFGGRDESSQDLIQGITLAGVLFDEVALMPESFVNQATGRCSVAGAKSWFNCNPDSPSHWFLKRWIEDADTKRIYHIHFLMDDNPSLSEAVKERYETMYSGVFYQRFILGKWVMAQGAIYRDAWDDEAILFGSETMEWISQNKAAMRRFIAIDYGTVNPMAFLDIYDDGKHLYVVNEYYWDSRAQGHHEKDNSQYAADLMDFINRDTSLKPEAIVIDPSAASFKIELRNRGLRTKETIPTVNADNSVIEGIRNVSTMMTKKLIHIHRDNCPNTIRELKSYVWDDKALVNSGKEKPLKVNDHTADALRYGIMTMIRPRRIANA